MHHPEHVHKQREERPCYLTLFRSGFQCAVRVGGVVTDTFDVLGFGGHGSRSIDGNSSCFVSRRGVSIPLGLRLLIHRCSRCCLLLFLKAASRLNNGLNLLSGSGRWWRAGTAQVNQCRVGVTRNMGEPEDTSGIRLKRDVSKRSIIHDRFLVEDHDGMVN